MTGQDINEKFRRALVLLQLLLNTDGYEHDEVEHETRAQLKEWGVHVPEYCGPFGGDE